MMKHPQISWAVFVLFMGMGGTGYGQRAVTAAGSDASGSGGSVSYSVGQVVYTANTGNTGSVSQGVQQAYRISSGSVEEPGIQLHVAAYPNPATDFLVLETESGDFPDLSYELFDMNGKRLAADRLAGTKTQISMSALVPATYYVKVLRGKAPVKTFTVIKTM